MGRHPGRCEDPNDNSPGARRVTLDHGGVWVPGGPRGLQNRRGGDELPGGFDSRPPPRGEKRGVVVESRELHILPAIPPRHLAHGAGARYPWPRYSLSATCSPHSASPSLIDRWVMKWS